MRSSWVDTFVEEAEDLLAHIEDSVFSLSGGGDDAEAIHDLFRAFHTIKGSSGMCGLDAIADFTHHVETRLDQVRSGAVPVTPMLIDAVLAARDQITALIAAEVSGQPPEPGSSERVIGMLEALAPGGDAPASDPEPCTSPEPETRSGPETDWRIHFRPSPDILQCGANPAYLIRDLRAMGACQVSVDVSSVPPLEEINPELCYLAWTIELRSSATLDDIRDVFMFVEDGSRLDIEAVGPAPEGPEPAPAEPETSAPAPAESAPRKARDHGPSKAPAKDATVRVPSDRLDRLVSLVGELVMNQSRLAQAAQGGTPALAAPVQEIERLVGELRDDVLGIRMLPIGAIFGRFRRLVHDLSAELGKEVELVTVGAETEMDKSILDQIGEPLIHILRNCIDHGIEPADVRERNGKPRCGTIRLSAAHVGSNVVISIEDDGRGINRAAVRAKAIERRLIAPEAALGDRETLNLILQPGFSTAQAVTNVSGRGVGMDVVKRQVEAMRGSLSMTSEEGQGTCMSLSLPLTLAIIEGLLVEVGSDLYIIPMAVVTENVDLTREQRARGNGRNVIAVRGELIPYIDLREAFAIGGPAPAVEMIVIVHHDGERVGLVVDKVLGSHQTVLQSLGRFYRDIKVVSGATIMGDGRVALVFDIPAVVRLANEVNQPCAAGAP